MQKVRQQTKGFTLLELIITVVIVGILASVVIGSVANSRQNTKLLKMKKDLTSISQALDLYRSNNAGLNPCLDHLWDDTREKTWSAPYIDWPTHPFLSSNNQYHLEHSQYSNNLSVSIRDVVNTTNATALDTYLDDGNLTTGNLRGSYVRLEYLGLTQTPYVHCH